MERIQTLETSRSTNTNTTNVHNVFTVDTISTIMIHVELSAEIDTSKEVSERSTSHRSRFLDKI